MTSIGPVAVVQARMSSVRFPGKVMAPLGHTSVIGFLLERLGQCTSFQEVVVAVSDSAEDDALVEHVEALGVRVFRGSESDVLDRVYWAVRDMEPPVVLRITADCPLVDPGLVDEVVAALIAQSADYATNTMPPTYPDGLDVEVFTFATLERAWRDAEDPYEREHVTPYMRDESRFLLTNVVSEMDESTRRWTIDDPRDLEVVQYIVSAFDGRKDFSWSEVVELENSNPDQFAANRSLRRNEGSKQSTGQKLWHRAKRIIPGGTMLLSKNPEMFLPGKWPAYFSRARGCQVWDLDNREYLDMGLMGVGTNTLGYGHPDVDDAVRTAVDSGNMSTLNCPEEVWLAEKLVAMHPWAEMVRFARTGGEADAIAIRIARAATGKDDVAFCGYHGWHDWYLSANLEGNSSLSEHLLPGLDPAGVPKGLKGSVHPFLYNDFDGLERIFDKNPVGTIMMEVMRSRPPTDGFLTRVRDLATRNGAVLIFDECTSGFRQTFGGLHLEHQIEPDIAVFGKALGNGYAITAVIGRREVMEYAKGTFISSTFWTERIGPAAALKTLEVMEAVRSWDQITSVGNSIRQEWQLLAKSHQLELEIGGLPALSWFAFPGADMPAYKTLITQELLKLGILGANSIYTSTAHSPSHIDRYVSALNGIFDLVVQCENGRSVADLLEGPIAQTGFARLN